MDRIKPPTRLERVAGSKATEIVLTKVAASAGGMFAPLLPVLAKSLAADRQRKRVDDALQDIRATLEANEEAVGNLSDEQSLLALARSPALGHSSAVKLRPDPSLKLPPAVAVRFH